MRLEELSAEELDKLIAKASEIRSTKNPAFPNDPPEVMQAIYDPAWYSVLTKDNRVALNIRHPGLGWLAFVLPHHEAKNIFNLWAKMFGILNQTGAKEGEEHGMGNNHGSKH